MANPRLSRTMKTRYVDLIEQTFDFPKDEFTLDDDNLVWNDLPLVQLIEKHGTPLRITYLPERGYQADAYYLRIKTLKDRGYVTPSTLNRLVDWGASIWPKGNWQALRP